MNKQVTGAGPVAVWTVILLLLQLQVVPLCRAEDTSPRPGAVTQSPEIIAVVTSGALPVCRYEIPLNKSEAARELAGDAANKMASDIHSAGLAPVVALVASVLGAAKGVSPAKSRAAEAVITNAVTGFPLAERVCSCLTNCAPAWPALVVPGATRTLVPGRRFTPVENSPTHPGMWDANTSIDFSDDKIFYPALAQQGMGLALELEFMDIKLEYHAKRSGESSLVPVNAPLTLIMAAEAKLIRLHDGKILHRSRVEFEGPRHRFLAWAAGDGRRLREALETGCRNLAADLADQLVPPPAMDPKDTLPPPATNSKS
jgi:hypothetical protein